MTAGVRVSASAVAVAAGSRAGAALGLAESSDPMVLVPGDPVGLRVLAEGWEAHAGSADTASAEYRRAVADGWEGAGSDAFEAARDRQAARATATGSAYREAAAAVSSHAAALQAGRRLAERAAAEWARGDAATASARLAHDARAERARANPYALQPIDLFVDPGVAIRDNAEALLEDARAAVAASEADTVRTLDTLAGRAFTASVFRGSPAPATLAEVMARAGEKQLFRELRRMSLAELQAYAVAHPDLIDRLLALGPANIAAWWRSLDDATRDRLARGLPRVIGNLDGVDARTRSAVNAEQLTKDLGATTSRVAGLEQLLARTDPSARAAIQIALDREKSRLAELTAIQKAFGDGPDGEPPRQLYAYSLGERTKAAVSVGLIDDAEHVTVVVPGMGTTVRGMGEYANAARDLRGLQAVASGIDPSRIAVIAWLDYDPPGSVDVWGVAHDDLAEVGADRLVHALQGVQAINGWGDQPPGLSIVAHSYGTNVAAEALSRPGASAGNVVLLGSAGITGDAPTAVTLNVPDDQVFATQAVADEWAPIGQIISGRQDPTSPGFGAHVFTSESTTIDGRELDGVTTHGPFGGEDGTSYLDKYSSALSATAIATMGRGAELAEQGTPGDRFTRRTEESLRRWGR